jgi:hypothetical protein
MTGRTHTTPEFFTGLLPFIEVTDASHLQWHCGQIAADYFNQPKQWCVNWKYFFAPSQIYDCFHESHTANRRGTSERFHGHRVDGH